MPNNPLPVIRASHVVTPNPLTTSLGVQFLGAQAFSYYGFTAVAPRRPSVLATTRPARVLHVSVGVHGMLRQQCLGFDRLLRTEMGQRVVRDFVLALSHLDGRRVMEISTHISRGLVAQGPRTGRPEPPRRVSDRERAVDFLVGAGRSEQAYLVEQVAARYSQLSVREQEAAGQAIRAIIDAFTFLGRLAPQMRTTPGPDGHTPEQDAMLTVDAALRRLADSLTEAQRGDADGLRALRIYAAQWDRNDDPLRLD